MMGARSGRDAPLSAFGIRPPVGLARVARASPVPGLWRKIFHRRATPSQGCDTTRVNPEESHRTPFGSLRFGVRDSAVKRVVLLRDPTPCYLHPCDSDRSWGNEGIGVTARTRLPARRCLGRPETPGALPGVRAGYRVAPISAGLRCHAALGHARRPSGGARWLASSPRNASGRVTGARSWGTGGRWPARCEDETHGRRRRLRDDAG
jgi:hypothetical protein